MSEVRLERVCKSFPGVKHALDDVSLTVKAGECLAVVGPSGCGKTTLLRIIAGLESATSGHVFLGGRCANDLPCHARELAMLFQRPALIPNQTVRQNLRWAWTLRRPWLRFFGEDRRREADLDRLAGELGLENDLDRPVQQLSGGQQQRVALGRCLLREAMVYLLDEPLGQLDATLRTDLRRLIRELVDRRGVTLLFVTHDPAEALAVGDRIAVMEGGRIVQVDVPEQLLRQPASKLVAELTHHDRGGLNCLPGRLEAGTFVGPFGPWQLRGDMRSTPDFRADAKKIASKDHSFHIIMGIAANNIDCVHGHDGNPDTITVTLRVVRQEATARGTLVIAEDERGRLIGRPRGEMRFESGQMVTMMFSMQDVFGFDAMTGRTLWTPG